MRSAECIRHQKHKRKTTLMFKKCAVVALAVLATLMIIGCQQPDKGIVKPNIDELPALTEFRGIPSEYFYPDYDEWGTPNDYNRGVINLKAVKGTGLGDELRENYMYIYETSNQIMVLERHMVNFNETYHKYMTDGYFLCTYMKSDSYEDIISLINNSNPILAYYLVPSAQGKYSYITKDGEFGGASSYVSSHHFYSFDSKSLRRGITKIEQVFKIEFNEEEYNYKDITDTPEAQPYLGWIIPGHNGVQVGGENVTFSFRTDTDNIFLLPNVYSRLSLDEIERGLRVESPVGALFNNTEHGLMSDLGEKASVIAAYNWTLTGFTTHGFYGTETIGNAKSNVLL